MAVVVYGRAPGPTPSGNPSRAEKESDYARCHSATAQCVASDDLLRRQTVSRRISRGHLRFGTRILEPGSSRRIRSDPCASTPDWTCEWRVRGFSYRVRGG